MDLHYLPMTRADLRDHGEHINFWKCFLITNRHTPAFARCCPSRRMRHQCLRLTRAAGSGGARSLCQGLAKGKQGLVAPTCLLSPFPLAGPLVVVGKTALDQIAALPIARHD